MIKRVYRWWRAMGYWFWPKILISVDFDIHNPSNLEIVRDIESLFAISALFQIFEAMRISLFGALRALHDTHFTLLISILSFWGIALPLGYLLATRFHFGGEGTILQKSIPLSDLDAASIDYR